MPSNSEITRTVVVTGGGSGIGQEIASAFSRQGSQVIIIGRNEDRLLAAAEALGPRISWQRADVSQLRQVISSVESIVKRFGRIDVLVNNAAATLSGRITTETHPEEAEKLWDEQLDITLKGSFLMAMVVAPHLRRPGGRIINISSIAAFTGGSRPGAIAYAAAKAGLLGLTYALARELSPKGITVNAVAPGFIVNTGMTRDWPEERVKAIVEETPVGRVGNVGDVAAAALYLASPEASFVTGSVLSVNGGWLFGR